MVLVVIPCQRNQSVNVEQMHWSFFRERVFDNF